MMKSMNILAIETSCDETSLALVYNQQNNTRILAHFVHSQIKIHSQYGGVVPEVAARNHIIKIFPLLEKIEKILALEKIDLIAVTFGPGLITSLMVGVWLAKTLSYVLKIPILPLNHLEGHIAISILPQNYETKKTFKVLPISFPLLALIVSGGHTELIFSEKIGQYKIIGKTLDDAAGEAFDKVAKLLGLGYPGGPILSHLAEKGDRKKYAFPRPMIQSKNLDMSFSGLKTAVLYTLKDLKNYKKEDVAASFEEAVVDTLVLKTINAIKKYKPKSLILGGGVAANLRLREVFALKIKTLEEKTQLFLPEKQLTTDNALMIALAAIMLSRDKKIVQKRTSLNHWKSLAPDPNLTLLDVSQ